MFLVLRPDKGIQRKEKVRLCFGQDVLEDIGLPLIHVQANGLCLQGI